MGFSFGLTSGVITTLGLVIGLSSGTHSRLAVIGGVLTIAVADSFSDAVGVHVSEESEGKHTQKEVWESTISTFISKFLFTNTFVIPTLLLSLQAAIIVSLVWGLSLLSFFSFLIAKEQKVNPWKVVLEHLFITLIVVTSANYIGSFISSFCSLTGP